MAPYWADVLAIETTLGQFLMLVGQQYVLITFFDIKIRMMRVIAKISMQLSSLCRKQNI